MHVFREGGVAKLMRERRDDCVKFELKLNKSLALVLGSGLKHTQNSRLSNSSETSDYQKNQLDKRLRVGSTLNPN